MPFETNSPLVVPQESECYLNPVDFYKGFDMFEIGVSSDNGGALSDGCGHGEGIRIGHRKSSFHLRRFNDKIKVVFNKNDGELKELIPKAVHILREILSGDLIIHFARIDLVHQD